MQPLGIKTKALFLQTQPARWAPFTTEAEPSGLGTGRSPMPRIGNLKVRPKEGFSAMKLVLFLPAATTQISICFPGPGVDQQTCVISLGRGHNGNIVPSGTREVFIRPPALGRHSSRGVCGSMCTEELGRGAPGRGEASELGCLLPTACRKAGTQRPMACRTPHCNLISPCK